MNTSKSYERVSRCFCIVRAGIYAGGSEFSRVRGGCEMAVQKYLRASRGDLTRMIVRCHWIDKDSLPYKLFTEHGFTWGGDWSDRKDYQHFELPTALTEILYPDNK